MKKQRGLSLIEVLIASIILFMSLGLIAVIFQQNFDTQRRAQLYLQDAQEYPSVLAQVRFELEQGTKNGEIESALGVYRWQAEALESAVEVEYINPESGLPQGGTGLLNLFEITVENEQTHHGYSFRQAVWLNSAG